MIIKIYHNTYRQTRKTHPIHIVQSIGQPASLKLPYPIYAVVDPGELIQLFVHFRRRVRRRAIQDGLSVCDKHTAVVVDSLREAART